MPTRAFNDINGIKDLLINISNGEVHSFEIVFRYYITTVLNKI